MSVAKETVCDLIFSQHAVSIISMGFTLYLDKGETFTGTQEQFFNRGVKVKNHPFDITEVSIFWPQSQNLGGQLTPWFGLPVRLNVHDLRANHPKI